MQLLSRLAAGCLQLCIVQHPDGTLFASQVLHSAEPADSWVVDAALRGGQKFFGGRSTSRSGGTRPE